MNDVATVDPSLPVLQDARAETLLQAIFQMGSNLAVDPARMVQLLDLHERLERRQAEVEFNQALARLAGKMPSVEKNGTVSLGAGKGSYPFARWEDIDKVIRPLMAEEGFTLAFTSEPRQADGGGLIVTGTLLHRLGHSRSALMPLALDTGPGRNNLQAMGSTLSYGKRYCAEMLLNIVRKGEDDDGVRRGAEFITEEQCADISRRVTDAKWPLDNFLKVMGVDAIPSIHKAQLVTAENLLTAKIKQNRKTENVAAMGGGK